jgi:hypothetical protein
LVLPKKPGILAEAGSRSRLLILIAGNEAEATSGGLETLVMSCATRARIRLPPRPRWCEPDFLIMRGAKASVCRSSLATTRLGFLQLCA